jgi:hypothetical protein
MNKIELELLLREIDHQIAICKTRSRMNHLKGRRLGVMVMMATNGCTGKIEVSA